MIGNSGVPRAFECLLAIQWCPAFSSISTADLRPLARASRLISLAEGSVLFGPGDPLDGLYVVESGSLELAGSAATDRTPVAVVGPGDIVGTALVAPEGVNSHSAVATSPARVVELPRRDVLDLFERHPNIRAHLRDVFERRQLLYRAASTGSRTRHKGQAEIVAVHSPKGGAGTTTIAISVAAALGASGAGDVVLVDLALPFNDCARFTGTVPTASIARVGQLRSDQVEDAIVSAVVPVGDISLLVGALGPAEADLITPALVESVLAALRREFRYIVVDTGVSRLLGTNLLSRADLPLLVLSPEVSAVSEVVRLLPQLSDRGRRPRVLFNHPAPVAAVRRRSVERLLRLGPVIQIPFDRRVHELVARGRLTMAVAAGSRVAKAVRPVTADLAAKTAHSPQVGGRDRTRRQRRWTLS